MAAHSLECEHRTHVGLVRQHNEDYLTCFPDLGILVLADGMGGHQAGEVAARIAVEAAAEALLSVQEGDLADELESLLQVERAAECANQAVFAAVGRDPALEGMGTTLVAAMFRERRVYYSHVGDSRLYRLRDGTLRCLTRDHSLVQEVLDNGLFASRAEVQAAGIGDNILTRCIGLHPDVDVDVGDTDLRPGDLFLACTDGLCGKVSDQTIQHVMVASRTLGEMASDLVELALQAGGRDNISVILARPRL